MVCSLAPPNLLPARFQPVFGDTGAVGGRLHCGEQLRRLARVPLQLVEVCRYRTVGCVNTHRRVSHTDTPHTSN
jgi:hypothetical protein